LPLGIALDGAPALGQQGKLIALSAKSPDATNSIANPEAVVPVERTISVSGSKFEQTFAPYSVNVLELSY